MLIFAYGSNMLSLRLKKRISPVKIVGTAFLEEHQLRFNKKGNDGSAKANAWHTGNSKDKLWGVIWEIGREQKPVLDRIESLGKGYDEKYEIVKYGKGEEVEVQLYFAMDDWLDQTIKPFDWYRHFVLLGALENELPRHYINSIRNIKTVIDHDRIRARENRKILEQCPGYGNDPDRIF